MLHPEPMPASAVGRPVTTTDSSWLGCFSYHIGLISLCWTLVIMSLFSFFTFIEYMVVAGGGGALAVFIVAFLLNLVDGAVSALLLMGVRDGVVRVRLNIWLMWNAIYSLAVLLLVIVDLSAVVVVAGLGVLNGLQAVVAIGFRLLCIWTGWMYRDHLMTVPPPPTSLRPDLGAF
ncbi:uncharacterized protein LOC122366498 [Amphibalanus amphitrite]|uniref:uncharacterized protein LOC122363271 n=1 Tax=Amphibalanus amphitrite TaxID=1232801 RepID=UPI001C919473|nr:uncharacterized protein LOC122363271 [Amphibalanus amphitrite]XP_043194758.1 uncharacterized protein LOC122366498 [Amphibalanus amphitrite]